MEIRFDSMDEAALERFYGGKGNFLARIFSDGQNKILQGRLVPGASIGYHCHETSCEIIYALSGEGIVNDNGVERCMKAGDCHYCPAGQSHALRNDGKTDFVFFAVVPQIERN